jgi:hypothetical protein
MHELDLGSSGYHPIVGFRTYMHIGESLCSMKADSLSTSRIIINYSKKAFYHGVC